MDHKRILMLMHQEIFSLTQPRLFAIMVSLFFLQTSVLGQINVRFLEIPEKFVVPKQEIDLDIGNVETSGNPWVVYSERQYNKSYTSHNGKYVKQILEYLYPYYVSENKNNYLHLYKKNLIVNTDSISYDDCGWAHIDNLLLWNHCLVSEKYINLKTLLSNSNKNITNKDISDTNLRYNIFYIYKIQKNQVLIGRAPRFMNESDEIEKCIVSWIPSDNLWIWDNNSVMEPIVCTPEDIGQKCLPENICFYDNRKDAKKSIKKTADKDIVACITRDESFWKPQTLRFPLTSTTDNIAEIVFIESFYNNKVSDDKNQILFTPIVYQNESNDILIKKILFTAEDLARINSQISNIIKADGDLSREMIVNNYLNILRNEFYDLGETELINLEMDKIHDRLFNTGYNTDSKTFVKLYDLKNPKIVSDSLFTTYINSIKQSNKTLLNIINDSSKESQFKSNGILYYWINASVLPKLISQI